MKNRFFLVTAFFLCAVSFFIASPILFSLKEVATLWKENTPEQTKKLSLNIPSWAPVVNKALPAVVVITTEATINHPPVEFPGLPIPFRYYTPPEKQQGQGSGFIINEDGYFITNQHVIEGAQKIKVKVGLNPQEYSAKIIGADESVDIALLQIETSEKNEKIKWPFLVLGNSDKMDLGDPILALGSPLGLSQSVNAGILSHKSRTGLKPSGRALFPEMWQLQMSIAPGSSGGPLLNDSGEVVGVSESIITGYQLAFGVPIDMVKKIIPDLLSHGSIEKAFLGVRTLDIDPSYAEDLGLKKNQHGTVVVQVIQKSPAEKIGLKPMDVILELDGESIRDSDHLRQKTAFSTIGKSITLKIFRKERGILIFKATLDKRPGQEPPSKTKEALKADSIYTMESIGLSVVDNPSSSSGAIIHFVKYGSLASFAELRAGDIIKEINKIPITSAKQVTTIFDTAKSGQTLLLIIKREKSEMFLPIKKP